MSLGCEVLNIMEPEILSDRPPLSLSISVSLPGAELAVFSQTMRGKDQVIYHGQPFILDKDIVLRSGEKKRVWRCNQWWSGKCRARIFTVGDHVWPLKNEHTHTEVIRRKKRVARPKAVVV